jgi:UDP-N-acetyl-2-amino-2-deoxyglucuronate dehydrogenase
MPGHRVAIIAAGGIGRIHARSWQAAEGAELWSVADTSREAVTELGDAFGIPPQRRYADFREMLDSERPDIVSICAWHAQHAEMTIAAAARKPKAILVEKPMATCLGDADEMLIACARNRVKLAVGHQHRFSTPVVEARRLIAAGAIGQPLYLSSTSADGLLNNGTHFVDLQRYLLGDPRTLWVIGNVERKTDRYERALPIEDACAGIIQYDGGAQGVIESDLPEVGSFVRRVVGTDGQLEIVGSGVRLLDGKSGGWQMIDVPGNDAYADQAREIVAWVDGKVESYRDEGLVARGTLEVLMAIYESARRHEVVRFPLQTRLNPLELMIETGRLPIERPGRYDIRSGLVRGEGMSWL